jgi:hypothetical protein
MLQHRPTARDLAIVRKLHLQRNCASFCAIALNSLLDILGDRHHLLLNGGSSFQVRIKTRLSTDGFADSIGIDWALINPSSNLVVEQSNFAEVMRQFVFAVLF